jgi:hypothetical protein
VAIDPSLLEWAEYWYPISWKGVLAGGLITAVGACATIVFLLLQWRTTTIREVQSDWRTSVLESETAKAKAELGTAQADIAKATAQIEEARARQREAELRLEQLRERLSQRHIKGEQFLKILDGKPKALVEILFNKDDGEAFQLSLEIRDWLRRASWETEEPRPIMQSDLAPRLAQSTPSAMAAGANPRAYLFSCARKAKRTLSAKLKRTRSTLMSQSIHPERPCIGTRGFTRRDFRWNVRRERKARCPTGNSWPEACLEVITSLLDARLNRCVVAGLATEW